MSPEDRAAVKSAYEAFGRGDMDALEKLLHPDIEWRTTPEVPFLGTYKGLEEFQRGMNEWTESFDDLTTEVEEMIDAGEHALVFHRMHGRGRDSGAEVDLAIWQVVSVRDGKLARMHDFMDRAEALAAAQLQG
jgi:ketosteroid isomerase-like protein